MKKLQLLVADDHHMFRTGIINLLQKDREIEVVAEASDGKEAVRLAAEHQPDVILMDIHLPEMNGIEATFQICKQDPSSRILVLTSYDEEDYVVRIIRAGAKGYILKESPIEELLLAIKIVAKGSTYFAKEIAATIYSLLEKVNMETSLKQKARRLEITGRELEVLQYIAQEYTNKEIAAKLFISPRTVETHRRNLIQKLRVKNTAGLVKYYFKNLQSDKGNKLVSN